MNPERWNQLEALFHEALTLPAAQRAAFVQLACNGEDALRDELLALLVKDAEAEARRFIATPALQIAPATTDALHAAETTAPHEPAAETDDIPRAPETNPQNQARQLDQYRLLDLLGRGGMGEVYLAEDTQLGKRVAIKLLSAAFSQDAQHIGRFQREARMLALAQHPNIAEAYLLREHARGHYLVMEFVPGDTLAQRIKRGALPLHEALPVLRQIAAALQAAHERKVIHRDLKPDNIKLTPDGTVKLLDFGLAKQLREELTTTDDAQPNSVFSTQRKVVAGTVPYMSPEQTRAEELDARSDLWSFGCVAFEMLTGARPFAGMSTHELFQAIRTQEPAWELLPAATPPALRQWLRQCLRKERKERLASAAEAVAALAQASNFVIQQARQRVWRKRASVAVLVLIAVTGVFYRQRLLGFLKARLAPMTASATRALPREKRLLIAPFKEKGTSPAFGQQLALVLQNSLRDVQGLQVMPYAEKLRLPSRNVVTAESLRPLGVNLVLTGEIEQQGTKVIVRYVLNDANGKPFAPAKQVEAEPAAVPSQLTAEIVLALLPQQQPLRVAPVLPNPTWQQQYLTALNALQDDLTPATLHPVIADLTALQQAAPDSVPLMVALAEAQLRLAKELNDKMAFRAALQLAERAIKQDSHQLDARLLRGKMLLLLNETSAAVTELLAVAQARPSDIEVWPQLGEAWLAANEAAQAEAAFKTVTNLWPSYWRGHNDLGVFYAERGRLQEAQTAFQRTLALHPASASGHINLGNIYIQSGKFTEALAAFEQARRTDFSRTESALEMFIGLGAAHYYLQQYAQAVASCKEGLALYPNNPTLHGNLGDALRHQVGNEQAALVAYAKAIVLVESDTPTAEGYATLGELRAKRSLLVALRAVDQNEARQRLRRALREGADSLDVQLRALLAFHLLGETDKALDHFCQALKLGLEPAMLAAEPDLAALRLDPGYGQTLQRCTRNSH
jgi:tetratricopeptide (TPR) repeat protein/TolB-like protein